jgi:hypothetical protein
MSLDNDGTRDLLPPISGDPEDVLGPEMPFSGSVLVASDAPSPSYPPAMREDASMALTEQEGGEHANGFGGSPVTMPLNAPSAAALHSSATPVEQPDGDHFAPLSVVHHASIAKPPAISSRDEDADHHSPEGEQGRAPESGGDGPGGGVSPGGSDPPLAEADGAHGINVTQIAIVDQEASILVNGYMGEVVARVHVDQDLLIDQDVGIDITIDGDGQLSLLLDQDMRIDLDIQIDLEMSDVDGVLYVDLFLHGSVEVEQDTTIDARISDGPRVDTVEVDQDIEIMQDVDIDIDIEDDLEERYMVEVGVETLQQADVDQDVVVAIKAWNGEIDVNVDASQTATVDQVAIVQVDFTLV